METSVLVNQSILLFSENPQRGQMEGTKQTDTKVQRYLDLMNIEKNPQSVIHNC